ncbi:MAG: hypothetical protein KC589_08785, partial [Nanoarchaeota archaeon]|nr:hypothetical protein [Nanoarchaeota archaeon]
QYLCSPANAVPLESRVQIPSLAFFDFLISQVGIFQTFGTNNLFFKLLSIPSLAFFDFYTTINHI